MSQSSIPSTTTAEQAVVRSNIYQTLSQGFKYPTTEVFHTFQSGEYLSELRQNLLFIPHLKSLANGGFELSSKSRDDLAKIAFEDFEVKFVHTFDVGFPEPPCPPYEGTYRQELEKTAIMIEVSEFYKHFGLKTSQEEGKRELPDHLCPELEFMHFLAFKEAQAREEENEELLQGYLRAQRDFLQRHPATWIPAFCHKLQESDTVPFYGKLAQIVSDVVQEDLKWLNRELEDT